MVGLDAALFHHLLEPSMVDWIGHIPADAPQNHLTFKMATIELDHRAVWLGPSLSIIPRVKSWIVRFFDGANEPTCALSTIAFLGLRVRLLPRHIHGNLSAKPRRASKSARFYRFRFGIDEAFDFNRALLAVAEIIEVDVLAPTSSRTAMSFALRASSGPPG